jgi:hypothetical protein
MLRAGQHGALPQLLLRLAELLVAVCHILKSSLSNMNSTPSLSLCFFSQISLFIGDFL